jgi:hypothetical protein
MYVCPSSCPIASWSAVVSVYTCSCVPRCWLQACQSEYSRAEHIRTLNTHSHTHKETDRSHVVLALVERSAAKGRSAPLSPWVLELMEELPRSQCMRGLQEPMVPLAISETC